MKTENASSLNRVYNLHLLGNARQLPAGGVGKPAEGERVPGGDEHSLLRGTLEVIAKLQALEVKITQSQLMAAQRAVQSEVTREEQIAHEFAALKGDDAAAIGTPVPAEAPAATSAADVACASDLDAKIAQFQLMAEQSAWMAAGQTALVATMPQ